MKPRAHKWTTIGRLTFVVGLLFVLVGTEVTHAQRNVASGAEGACALEATPALDDNGTSLVTFQDVTKGASGADVTVIEYFDPNCPHCKTFHDTMKELVAEYQEDVQFVFKPFPLQRGSLPEIQALYVAHRQGKFTELLEALYERQGRSGIGTQDLRAAAAEVDMNSSALLNRVEQGDYRDLVLKARKQAVEVGVDSTPTILVNGHFVASRSLDCMRTFVERAQDGTLGEMASR